MKLSTSEYFIKEVYTSFKRNIWMTLASIFTVVLSLFILGFFSIVILNLNKMADTLESQVHHSDLYPFYFGFTGGVVERQARHHTEPWSPGHAAWQQCLMQIPVRQRVVSLLL